jgi:hypothetical protein
MTGDETHATSHRVVGLLQGDKPGETKRQSR